MTWLDKVAMVPNVVMGVTREALDVSTVAPARLVETVPVTVPRVVTPTDEGRRIVKTRKKKKNAIKGKKLSLNFFLQRLVSLTCGPFDNQSRDCGFRNSGHGHWRDKPHTANRAHWHSSQNSPRLAGSTLQHHLNANRLG